MMTSREIPIKFHPVTNPTVIGFASELISFSYSIVILPACEQFIQYPLFAIN